MTTLDDYFGKKDIPELPKLTSEDLMRAAYGLTAVNEWRCEENIRSLLDAFAEEWPECVPVGSKSGLYASARELYDENLGADFVHWASHIMRQKNLDVKNLRSFVWLIGRWRKHGQSEDKYASYCKVCCRVPCEC